MRRRHVRACVPFNYVITKQSLLRIRVPKDYFNASAGTSTVAIAAYRATSKPSRGTLFLGAGGPGGSGQNLAFRLAETVRRNTWIRRTLISLRQFSLIVHGEYDIVGYDPRGVHNSR